LDDLHQPEGADVRPVDVEDLGRRAGFYELREHLAPEVSGVADLTVELAVGEGAGAALAELHVRFGVEGPPAPEPEGVDRALADLLAALEDDRPEAHLRQQQGGEEAAGPDADHHGPPGEVLGRPRREAVRR